MVKTNKKRCVKTHKELIVALKEVTFDSINSDDALFNTYKQIYNYSWGVAVAFMHSGNITKKEYDKFKDWLFDISTFEVEERINIGTLFKPKYEINKIKRWRRK